MKRLLNRRNKANSAMAELAKERARIAEKERLKKKVVEESENLYIIEIVKSFNLTSDDLHTFLSNNVIMQDNPDTPSGIIPAQSPISTVGTVPHKSKNEKENDNEEL
jgi:hypothetical protein